MNANRIDSTQRGSTLLEVLAASTLMAAVLVPTLELLRNGMETSRDVDTRSVLAVYGVSTMEQQLAIAAAKWKTGTVTGNFASDGHADIRFIATCTDEVAGEGIPDRLMAIGVTVYRDANSDSTLDANEESLHFSTHIGKFALYQSQAKGP